MTTSPDDIPDDAPAPDDPAPDDPAPEDDVTAVDPEDDDDLADAMSRQSFPTSDPPSTWAGADDGDGGEGS